MGAKESKIAMGDKITTCFNPRCEKKLTIGDVILDKDKDLNCAYCGSYTGIRFENIPPDLLEKYHKTNSPMKKRNSIKGLVTKNLMIS